MMIDQGEIRIDMERAKILLETAQMEVRFKIIGKSREGKEREKERDR